MLKKTTSLTLTFSGLVLLITSIVLYIGPPGHVGHFSPWRLLGLSKHYWGILHLNSGILFCLAMIIHVYLNWKPLMSYLKKRAREKIPFLPLIASLALTGYVCVGACYEVSPMGPIMDFARKLKMAAVRQYGSPPYGTSISYPIGTIAGYMGWHVETALKRLAEHNIIIGSPGESLRDVARNNGTSIGSLLDIMAGTGGCDLTLSLGN